MKLPSKLALLALAALLATGSAQAQEKVMRENQVTEQSLIDALSPAAAAPAAAPDAAASAPLGADGQPMRTRSFRPAVRPAAAAAAGTAATSAQQARASILVTFVTDSADLTPRAKSALDVLAGAMKSEKLASVKFTIEGHADPRGGVERNMKLSQLRAESVRAYLTSQHGLAAERVNAVGKGSTALMNPSDPAAPENRRVTIVAQP
ncbi:MAG: OmpA family protein [Rubrivivax sp.]|jgi:OOP family OmpA-OmpF porin|nr:OmpA family protein [Rubrivivax sp.]